MPKRQKKKKQNPKWKVYLSYSIPEQQFYIGMTSKTGVPLENYYGSNKTVQAWPDPEKLILDEFDKKSECRFVELDLQLQHRMNPRNINQMYNIRIQKNHVKDLTHARIYKVRRAASSLLKMLKF